MEPNRVISEILSLRNLISNNSILLIQHINSHNPFQMPCFVCCIQGRCWFYLSFCISRIQFVLLYSLSDSFLVLIGIGGIKSCGHSKHNPHFCPCTYYSFPKWQRNLSEKGTSTLWRQTLFALIILHYFVPFSQCILPSYTTGSSLHS